MNRKLAAPALAMMALAGCNLDRTQVKDPSTGQVAQTVYNSNSDRPGRLLEPRFCRLDTAIVSRPVGDKVIDASPWNVADEQMLPLEARLGLEANGLRAGIITGGLPADLMEAIKPNPPQKETQWVQTSVPEGERTPIVVGAKAGSVALLLNHNGKLDGRDYQDAEGRLVVTPSHSGSKGVSLRVVPEVHHGQSRRSFAPVENASPFAQREFSIKDGQREDILRELAMTVDLLPGQTLVIGCRTQQSRSLGTFLFLQPEPNGDRTFQSILLIQAGRNRVGEGPTELEAQPKEMPDLASKARPMPANDSKAP